MRVREGLGLGLDWLLREEYQIESEGDRELHTVWQRVSEIDSKGE
jgi:hypothetical protein